MFQTQGTLRYSENLPGKDQWWLVVDCCPDIVAYYKWLVERGTYARLNTPKFGSHISVISGEEPIKNIDKWGEHTGESITVDAGPLYSLDANSEDKSKIYCVNIECERLIDLRELFGLKKEYPFHLTIGWH